MSKWFRCFNLKWFRCFYEALVDWKTMIKTAAFKVLVINKLNHFPGLWEDIIFYILVDFNIVPSVFENITHSIIVLLNVMKGTKACRCWINMQNVLPNRMLYSFWRKYILSAGLQNTINQKTFRVVTVYLVKLFMECH